MPRFNFAQTAATQTAATTTQVVTEPTAPVAQPEPTATVPTATSVVPSPVPSASPEGQPTQAQKAISKINELMTADAIIQHTYMDAERDEARIKFTSSATDPDGLKKAAHWLSALNADWVFEGTGKERTAKSASLPSAVFTDPEAAESANEAARAKWDARKARSEEYKAKKAAEEAASAPGSGRTFSEAQVRALLAKANATLTADLIDYLIKTA